MVPAEPAHLGLDCALLMRPRDPGVASRSCQTGSGAQRHEPLGLNPVPPERHPGHRGAQVAVADPGRHPSGGGESGHVPVQDRPLALMRIGDVKPPTRVRKRSQTSTVGGARRPPTPRAYRSRTRLPHRADRLGDRDHPELVVQLEVHLRYERPDRGLSTVAPSSSRRRVRSRRTVCRCLQRAGTKFAAPRRRASVLVVSRQLGTRRTRPPQGELHTRLQKAVEPPRRSVSSMPPRTSAWVTRRP